MIRIDGKDYRSLEEQVRKNKEDIARHYEIDRVLANLGIKIVGVKQTPEELPDPATYPGTYGDAYAVGDTDAVIAGTGYYTYYVFSRPDLDAAQPNDHWLNIGRISLVGPQGPQGIQGVPGPKGDDGSKWYSGESLPEISPSMKDGYQALITANGDVYQLSTAPNGTRSWRITGNILGPQGIQGERGPRGEQGPQGERGPQGPTGDVGGFINIWGILPQASQLPDPATLANLSVAYLVGAASPYDLYVQIGETAAEAIWTNTGPFNAATLVTVEGLGQNVWDADTKLDKITTPTFEPITGADNISGNAINGVVYFLKYNGTNMTAPVASQGLPYTIPSRDAYGNMQIGNPSLDYHAANKRWVEGGFVAKQGASASNRIYGVNQAGEQVMYNVLAGQGANFVIMSDAYGCISAETPRLDNNCATKKYVDDEISEVSELVNALGIHSPTAVYEHYCGSNSVAVGGTFADWKVENLAYNIYEFNVSGFSEVTILSNLGGTVDLGNPKSDIFFSYTKEGTAMTATANIDLDPSDTLKGPFRLKFNTNANYLYISVPTGKVPRIQAF